MKFNMDTSWEYPVCNFCHSKKNKTIWTDIITCEHKEKFRLVRCLKCGLIYLNPRPKVNEIKRYYQIESYWGLNLADKKSKKINRKLRERNFGNIYHHILDFHKSGSILDIGCGTGEFLSKFQEIGWETLGIDI